MSEAAVDRRRTSAVGRHARLELTFTWARGHTVLSHAYAEPPYRIGRCFREGSGLHLIMASSAPGMFGADRFQQIVRVCRGARVRLTSQSALQLHPDRDGAPAELSALYDVEDEAVLSCHWDPLIPFAGAHFRQQIAVRVGSRSSVYWSDAFTSGRLASGEHWNFAELAHQFQLWRGESLDYMERYRIVPGDGRVTHRWIADDAAYFGTTLISSPMLAPDAAERAHRELAAVPGCRSAVDACAETLVIARLMTDSAVSFRDVRDRLSRRFLRDGLPLDSGGAALHS